jgi:CRISPR-associated endonuclease Csn1
MSIGILRKKEKGRKKMKIRDYYLGLDMRTSSVGWAVTDKDYNILNLKGKDLWGVRTFPEATTAQDRRMARGQRRRIDRNKARRGLVQEMFAAEINKVDPSFFQRLSESKFQEDERTISAHYSLFNDPDFTDKDYFALYPTIAHLRKSLIESNKPHDVRLVYLAVNNILSSRGHFNALTLGTENGNSFDSAYKELLDALNNIGIELDTSVSAATVKTHLENRDISPSIKADRIATTYGIKKVKDKQKYEVIKAICGLNTNLNVLFGEDFVGDKGAIKVSFREAAFLEEVDEINTIIGEANAEILTLLKSIFDQALLSSIMAGCKYLSQARVLSYNKHKRDLMVLKNTIKELAPDQYDMMFRSDQYGTYSAYVNSCNSDKKKRREYKERTSEHLYATIKKILVNEKVPQDHPDVQYILGEIEKDNFLPKQTSNKNSIIPNQLHLAELNVILQNAKEYLPFLTVKDPECNLTPIEKLTQLMTFRIPYYIGPLNDTHKDKGGTAWVVRKQQGKVLPWTFDEMIDSKKSAEEFIRRLIGKCTYIKSESVIPKQSLLYQEFMVLNELNNLRIKGSKPSVKIKQDIYNEVFLVGNKVTQKKVENWLRKKELIKADEKGVLSGIDGDFKSTLSTQAKFRSIFKDDLNKKSTQEMIERIVYWGTIYTEPKMFKEIIAEHYSGVISKEDIEKISRYQFKDWANLSREFLLMEGVNKETGEKASIIDMLWTNNVNLMELMSSEYTFTERLKQDYSDVAKTFNELEYEDLDDLYLTPQAKRMVWQTILLLQELQDIIGEAPARIFVKRARTLNGKQKPKARKAKLIKLYKGLKDDRDWVKELEKLSDNDLQSKKLYLYYTQQGRCMYSGEKIDIKKLYDSNVYDIDHIYPKKLTKDDDLDTNLVLVKRDINKDIKKDKYPIPESIQKSQKKFWESLLKEDMTDKFITREKFNRLTSKTEFSDQELAEFISKQTTESRQDNRAITNLLEELFPNTKVITTKAQNTANFRQEFELLKVRSLNDFHFAQDAYLATIVGNCYYVKFTRNPLNYILETKKGKSKYHMDKVFKYTIQRNDDTAWVVGDDPDNPITLATVKREIQKTTPLITRQNLQGHGQLYNSTIYGNGKAYDHVYIPLKQDPRLQDVTKYGGYTSISTHTFFLVEHTSLGRRARSIEALPLLYKDISNNKEKLTKYCEDKLGYFSPEVKLCNIKPGSLIKINGYWYYLTGKSLDKLTVCNAVPMILDSKYSDYIKKIENTLTNNYMDKNITTKMNEELYEILMKKHTESIFSKRANPIGPLLTEGQPLFAQLKPTDQCYVLAEILKLSQTANTGADLRLIGGKKQSGIMGVNKHISLLAECILVNQSISGLHSNRTNLLS